jgi:hypothetical protein
MTFDEYNGSQVEQVDSSVVGKEDPPCEAIKQLAIGDIRPQEDEATDLVAPLAADEEVFADVPNVERESRPLLYSSRVAVRHLGAAVPHPF